MAFLEVGLSRGPLLGLACLVATCAGEGWLVHESIGRNGDPASKVEAFEASLERGLGSQLDIALMKFCYTDIVAGSRSARVFERYETAMARIRERFPDLRLLAARYTEDGGHLNRLGRRVAASALLALLADVAAAGGAR